MPIGHNYTSFILESLDKITNFIGQISSEMLEYIENNKNSKFVLFYKTLTHSDLATFGKATNVNSHDKNLLYYITTEDMLNFEYNTGRPFQTAHQSCIGLKSSLYDIVGLPQPRNSKPYLINDYMNVFIVNSNMKYFTSTYTQKIFSILNKTIPAKSRSWNFDKLDVELNDGQFTPINLHVAVHGLGMGVDSDFHKIRHHLFKGDTLLLLFELNEQRKNMFLIFEKNPIFFSLIKETNNAYVRYQNGLRKRLINVATTRENAYDIEEMENEVTRQQQSAWRNMLANEMMAYTQVSRQIFCPLTYITADYDKLGSLFVASHIKAFSDPNTTNEQKYDINNGIIVCANADALFDKHLITINKDKQIVFSFLMDDDLRLKTQLLLMQPIFQPILNEDRMRYLAYHESVFNMKEAERRRNV